MKGVFAIGHNDLRLFLRQKTNYIWLFVIPLAFVYFMGFAARGPGDPHHRTPPVLVENLDTGFLGGVFFDELRAQGLWMVDPTNRAGAERGVRIPADFSKRVLAGEPCKVEFFQIEGSSSADAALIELRLVRALIAMNSHLLETVGDAASLPTLAEAALRQTMALTNPVALDSRFAGRRPVPTGFAFSLPGNLVMYLLMNLMIFGGATLASERRDGVLRRLSIQPVSRAAIIGGKLYGLMLLGAVQIAFFVLVGRFVFQVNLGANLPGVLLTLLVFSWVAASLGVLAGSVLRAEDRVTGLCVLVALLMAALGGCWWPLELAPDWLRIIARCLPTGWALAALHQLISFGSGLGAIVQPLLVLAGFGLAANVAAARFFRA
jgi:ABC-2 type transport system permease protein